MRRLRRAEQLPNLSTLDEMTQLNMVPDGDPLSIAKPLDDYISLLDSLRDGVVQKNVTDVPQDTQERANNLKSAGYFLDSSVMGICRLIPEMQLKQPFTHPVIDQWLKQGEGNKLHLRLNLAQVYERMEESIQASREPLHENTYALVIAVEYPRDPKVSEPGARWITDIQSQRAALRAAETASVLALYLRALGFSARAHSATSSDIDLNKVSVAAGVGQIDKDNKISNPFMGRRFGLAAVTTDLELACNQPLTGQTIADRFNSKGLAWWLGYGSTKNAWNRELFRRRDFKDSLYPMEKSKRVDEPTSFIDHERIPRVPKSTEFFVRMAFGDLGDAPQQASVDGFSVRKHPFGRALSSTLNGFAILQRGKESKMRTTGYNDPLSNADTIKATLHFLGADMVGICEAPKWAWYSHAPDGSELKAEHKYAITTLIDQGHDTMEGASGDDWMSAAQSMRSYMRASLLGGVVAQHLRNLGYPATNHTAADGDVLQPPLMLLSGLGEISRIGDLILNPHLGPRLKCGVVTTDFPMVADKPIDFGLQKFCGSCNKCARECPSGAITAGPKTMFNGYEIWKPDAEKCARYRMTNQAGSMCGRCMKTCPWNLEGLFKEAPYRWLATHFPVMAPLIVKVDDWLGNGDINPIKKWWWDIYTDKSGKTLAAPETNRRGLNVEIKLKHEDQTLACYPAEIAPSPYPEPSPIDREAGIKAYRELLSPEEHKRRISDGDTDNLVPQYKVPDGPPPVMIVTLKRRTACSGDKKIVKYEFASVDGSPLPSFDAGAHIDVTPVPQFIRQYSLCSDPADTSTYCIGVLREDAGRGGSTRLHKMLREGKPVLISRPRNHFPLAEEANKSILLAGGIGITPLIAMAHTLHAQGKEFVFYYKARTRAGAGFIDDLEHFPWADKVKLYFSDENRLDVNDVLHQYQRGNHLYTCGPAEFMDAVFASAINLGWHEDALHREYFTAPDTSELESHPFRLTLKRSAVEIEVPTHKKATEALQEAGYPVNTKCSDGLCGVCATEYLKGDVDHRDFVLSKDQRKHKIILCCSRAAQANGDIVLDL